MVEAEDRLDDAHQGLRELTGREDLALARIVRLQLLQDLVHREDVFDRYLDRQLNAFRNDPPAVTATFQSGLPTGCLHDDVAHRLSRLRKGGRSEIVIEEAAIAPTVVGNIGINANYAQG